MCYKCGTDDTSNPCKSYRPDLWSTRKSARITRKSYYLRLLDMLMKNNADAWNGSESISWLLKKECKYAK